MANLSELTRKQQVLAHLQSRLGQWVDGPDLATEEVGGSEGLRRLRELRLSGDHDIRERRHPDPDRDIWQYMLVEPIGYLVNDTNPQVRVPVLDLSEAFDDAKPPYPDHDTEVARRAEEAAALLDPQPADPKPSPWPADHDQPRIGSAVRRKEDGTFEYVPPQRALIGEQLTIPDDPPQPPTFKFDRLPKKIDWGSVAICPRCHSKTTRGRTPKEIEKDEGLEPEHVRQRKSKKKEGGSALIDEDGIKLFRDPKSRKGKPCEGCNGYGIIPNQGPIAITMPTGPEPAAAKPEAKPLVLDLPD